MFRLIKKYYFKLYHLFKFLGIFVLIFGLSKNVYAEEEYYCSKSVNKIISGKFINGYENPFGTARPNFVDITYNGIIEIKENEYYTFKFMTSPTHTNPWRTIFMFYDKNKEHIQTLNERNTHPLFRKTIISPEGTKYMIIGLYGITAENANKVTSILYEGEEYKDASITEPIIEYEQCSNIPENPEENEVYSNFLTLYIDRLNYLAKGFTENPYLLAMIGIIFAWVVLELFLKILHLRGGYKK